MAIKDTASRTINGPAEEVSSSSPVRRILLLVLGDAIVFLVFAAVGRRSHGEAAGVNALLQIAWTAAPFAAGWFLVAPFVGAYRRLHARTPRRAAQEMAQRTALSWVAAWPVGLLFRGLIERGVPPFSFMIVTLISNMVFLLLWRLPFAWFSRAKSR